MCGNFSEGSDRFDGLKFRKTSGIALKSERLLAGACHGVIKFTLPPRTAGHVSDSPPFAHSIPPACSSDSPPSAAHALFWARRAHAKSEDQTPVNFSACPPRIAAPPSSASPMPRGAAQRSPLLSRTSRRPLRGVATFASWTNHHFPLLFSPRSPLLGKPPCLRASRPGPKSNPGRKDHVTRATFLGYAEVMSKKQFTCTPLLTKGHAQPTSIAHPAHRRRSQQSRQRQNRTHPAAELTVPLHSERADQSR